MRTVCGLILPLLICIGAALRLPAAETNAAPVLTLAEAWQLALQNHPRVAAARYQAGAAEEAVKETRSAELPAANLYGTAAGANTYNDRIMAGGLNNPSVYDRVAGGVSVSQLITDFGHTANLVASSRLAARAENENAADVREQVWLQAATSYYNVLEAQAILQVAQQTVQTRQLLLEQVTALATNQLKSELDVSFARVAVEEGQLLLERAQNGTDAARATLADALGLREPQPFQLVEPAPPAMSTNDADLLIQTALGRRPELLSLRAATDAAKRFALSERDARRPAIYAEGVAGNSPEHDDRLANNYAAADLNVTLPLFSGGLYLARQHRAELQAAAADEQLRNAEDDVIREVRLAWLKVNNTLQLVQTTEALVRHATESYELADARYQAGLSSIVELTDAQLSLISAQIAQANAHYDLLAQQADLDYQTGTLH
jgi:outer membrane protein